MASAVRAIKSNDPGAYAALFSATSAYGFVHALGPGHGKYIVWGIGLVTQVSTLCLVGLAAVASLAQALWVILLVYGGFTLLEIGPQKITYLAKNFLLPASHLAIACIGLLMVWRGVRLLKQLSSLEHVHTDCNCHSHVPTPEEVAGIGSLGDANGLVLSIAVRPCTGAIFL